MDTIIEQVNAQLLQSNLEDSMLPGTGLPPDVHDMPSGILEGPFLVEIVALSEIGHSAVSLQNVDNEMTEWRKSDEARTNRGDDELDDDEDLGPMPQFPRSMLHFEVSDGSVNMQAFEYRPLPLHEFILGGTSLGYKVCSLF